MEIRKVGVLGCGLMGSGIAQISAQAGYETVVREVTGELLDKGLDRIRASLDKAVRRGKMDEGSREEALGNLTGTVELSDLGDCDLVVEAIVENLKLKQETLAAVDALLP